MPRSSSTTPAVSSRPRSAADAAWTAALSALLLGACWIGFVFSGFAVMATDGCFDECVPRAGVAYGFGWGGMVLALLVTLVGAIAAAVRRRRMCVWPVIGWGVFIVGYVAFLVILQWATGAVV